MKLFYSFLFVVISAFSVVAQPIPAKPNPPRIVNDFANLLSTQEQQMLEQKLRGYNDTTSTQIAIVTVTTLGGYDVSEYAFKLGRDWGIGQKGKNNGVLILIKPKAGNERGQVFIATGYGMEGAVTDAQSNRIVKQILIPAFQQNQYYKGLDLATTRLIQIAAGEYKADKKGGAGEVSPITSLIIFAIILVVFIVIAAVARSKRFASNSSVFSSNGYRANNAASSLPFWLLMMGMGSSLSDRNRHSNSSWSDFSGGGGFGGGDFGGFGGGDFGGGGAGGSW